MEKQDKEDMDWRKILNTPGSILPYRPSEDEIKAHMKDIYGLAGDIRHPPTQAHFKIVPQERISQVDIEAFAKRTYEYKKLRKFLKYLRKFFTKLFIIILIGLGMYKEE